MTEASKQRTAIVTGVSRRSGIGFAVARRLLADGLRVLVHSWSPADAPGGRPDPGGTASVLAALGGEGGTLAHFEADLADPAAPAAVVGAAIEAFGAAPDVLVATHASSPADDLRTTSADLLDHTWAVNARAAVLLCQAFARRHGGERPHGRVVLFTSGQHREPMPEELSYAISKGALHQMTPTLADALAGQGITVNAVNPGPVDTGWPSRELRERLARAFPAGRWGTPEDIAKVVAWLCSPESAWMTGQVLDVEGGFRRRAGG